MTGMRLLCQTIIHGGAGSEHRTMTNPIITGIEFDEVAHNYRVLGDPCPSVTEVLTDMGCVGDTRWFKEKHRNRGGRVHSLVKQIAWLRHPQSEYEWDRSCDHPGTLPYGIAFDDWCTEVGFEVIAAELPMYLDYPRVAGTPDLVGILRKLRGSPVGVVDCKSGGVYPSVELQTAPYAKMAEKHLGVKIDARYSLMLTPEGRFKFRECAAPSDWQVFMGLTIGWHWRKAHGLIEEGR